MSEFDLRAVDDRVLDVDRGCEKDRDAVRVMDDMSGDGVKVRTLDSDRLCVGERRGGGVMLEVFVKRYDHVGVGRCVAVNEPSVVSDRDVVTVPDTDPETSADVLNETSALMVMLTVGDTVWGGVRVGGGVCVKVTDAVQRSVADRVRD